MNKKGIASLVEGSSLTRRFHWFGTHRNQLQKLETLCPEIIKTNPPLPSSGCPNTNAAMNGSAPFCIQRE